MHALWHALLLAHQPHDNTYGLAATPDGQTVFVDSRHCIYRSQDAGDSWQKANGAGLPLVAGFGARRPFSGATATAFVKSSGAGASPRTR